MVLVQKELLDCLFLIILNFHIIANFFYKNYFHFTLYYFDISLVKLVFVELL